jgi:hypothetical protein
VGKKCVKGLHSTMEEEGRRGGVGCGPRVELADRD